MNYIFANMDRKNNDGKDKRRFVKCYQLDEHGIYNLWKLVDMNTHVECDECFAVFLKSEATTKIVECNTGKQLRYFCRA